LDELGGEFKEKLKKGDHVLRRYFTKIIGRFEGDEELYSMDFDSGNNRWTRYLTLNH
jgi:hypothetical protein